jgi:hypothetical protein
MVIDVVLGMQTYNKYLLTKEMLTDELIKKFENMCQQNKLKWQIEKMSLFTYDDGLTKKDIIKVKNFYLERSKNWSELLYPKQPLHKIIFEFLKLFNGLKIAKDALTIYRGFEIASRAFYIAPKCLDGLLRIASYYDGGIVFTNRAGNVFVFDEKQIDSLNRMPFTKEDKKKMIKESGSKFEDDWYETDTMTGIFMEYRKIPVTLHAYWDNFEDFLYEETKRLTEMWLANPWHIPPAEILPHNITPELFNKLKTDGKINDGIIHKEIFK